MSQVKVRQGKSRMPELSSRPPFYDTFHAFMAAQKTGLLCVNGGVAHYEIRDDEVRLYAIVSTTLGGGKRVLDGLVDIGRAHSCRFITAYCEGSWPANTWYQNLGWCMIPHGEPNMNKWVYSIPCHRDSHEGEVRA